MFLALSKRHRTHNLDTVNDFGSRAASKSMLRRHAIRLEASARDSMRCYIYIADMALKAHS